MARRAGDTGKHGSSGSIIPFFAVAVRVSSASCATRKRKSLDYTHHTPRGGARTDPNVIDVRTDVQRDLDLAPQQESRNFADHAISLRRAGFAVLPLRGKVPLIRGFAKWRAAPGENEVGRWASKHAGAAIGYVPGLCTDPLVVVDGDDAEACDRIQDIFGRTPGQVQTRRGRHFIFAARDADLGSIASLKPAGLNADLKHGRSIVVAPPSRHATDLAFQYAWIDCDPTVIRALPPFNVAALRKLLERACPAPTPSADPRRPFRNGSRGLSLNDHLVAHAWAFDSVDGALDVARTWNSTLAELGFEPLDDGEILRRTDAVMRDLDIGKIGRWHGRRASCTSDVAEIRHLTAKYPNGADALALLLLLRGEHGARCLRGETFAIVPKAMAAARVIGGWGHQRYRDARETLLGASHIKEVAPATSRVPAQYTLTERVPAVSETAR